MINFFNVVEHHLFWLYQGEIKIDVNLTIILYVCTYAYYQIAARKI